MKDLLETVPDLVWQKDAEGVYLHCNRATEQFLGISKSEIVGKTAYDFISADVADALRKHDRVVVDENRVVTSEEWLTSPYDGRSRLYETIRSPYTDEIGRVIGVFGIARDVTQRHDALNEAKFFRNLVENSSDSIFVLDPEDGSKMVFANEAACRHFGVSRERLLTMRVPDWDPDVTLEKLESLNAQLELGNSMFIETRHKREPGIIVPVEVSANRMHHDGRKYNAGYIRDISERKQVEEAFQRSHKQLIDITSNVPGIVYEFQRTAKGQYRFPFMSNTVQTMFGVTSEEVSQDPDLIFSFAHPDDLEALYASIEESAETLRPWNREFRVVLPALGVRWVFGSAKPEKHAVDNSITWHGFLTDITKIKHTENELMESQERLRKLIGYQENIREIERKQAAKELHDEMAQHLLAIKIDLSLLPRSVGGSNMLVAAVDEIVEKIDSTIKSAREIMNNLRPSVLDLGLYAAFDWQTKEFERKSGIACSLIGNEEELELEERSATKLFRIMQEALSDIQHHGQATQVSVSLQQHDNSVVMRIADNGNSTFGAFGDSILATHTGIEGINELVGMLGGSAKFEHDERENGSVLSVSLPLTAQAQLRFS